MYTRNGVEKLIRTEVQNILKIPFKGLGSVRCVGFLKNLVLLFSKD